MVPGKALTLPSVRSTAQRPREDRVKGVLQAQSSLGRRGLTSGGSCHSSGDTQTGPFVGRSFDPGRNRFLRFAGWGYERGLLRRTIFGNRFRDHYPAIFTGDKRGAHPQRFVLEYRRAECPNPFGRKTDEAV